MHKLSVSRSFYFDAAHRLPDHMGQCANSHGHTYKLEVTVSFVTQGNSTYLRKQLCPKGSAKGMIIDFGQFKRIVKETVVDKLDHKYLNDVVFSGTPMEGTTCEIMVIEIWERLEPIFRAIGLSLTKLRLWETIAPTENFATMEAV